LEISAGCNWIQQILLGLQARMAVTLALGTQNETSESRSSFKNKFIGRSSRIKEYIMNSYRNCSNGPALCAIPLKEYIKYIKGGVVGKIWCVSAGNPSSRPVSDANSSLPLKSWLILTR